MDLQGFIVRSRFYEEETDIIQEKSACGQYLRYKKILGRGAFKDVYKGYDQIGNTEIAWNQICVDDETTLESVESRQTLCYEAVLLKSLHHKNIMKCYDYWIDDKNKTVNLITELFPSGSLRQYMKKLGSTIDVLTIKNWGRQILQGLNYLHTQSNPRIIHRDLKCANIFLDVEKDEIKIGDFGLATPLHQASLRALAGTPEFMAPEYYDEEYNELVDIYSFGLCLMEMATLEYPYSECTNPAQIFKKVSSGIKPIALGKVKDPELKAIIEKCLLTVSLRPSAMDLLKDPFFGFGVPMEIKHDSSSSCSIASCVDFSSSVTGTLKESGVNFSSSLEVAYSFDAMDSVICNGDPQYINGAKKYSMHESVLSDISALYKSMVVSDATNNKLVDRLVFPTSCNYQSSVGDVSMNSKITFDSSLGAALDDLSFCMSSKALQSRKCIYI